MNQRLFKNWGDLADKKCPFCGRKLKKIKSKAVYICPGIKKKECDFAIGSNKRLKIIGKN